MSSSPPPPSVKLAGFAPAAPAAAAPTPVASSTVAAAAPAAAAPAVVIPVVAPPAGKKRKTPTTGGGPTKKSASTATDDDESASLENPVLTLAEIRARIVKIRAKLPSDSDLPPVPPSDDDDDDVEEDLARAADVKGNSKLQEKQRIHRAIRTFASSLQVSIEEFNLLLALVSPATYKWGVDRSGASQQSLAVMSAELMQCQETMASVVNPRLSNVLCPATDIILKEVQIVRGGDGDNDGPLSKRETRTNIHKAIIVDPNYRNLCFIILSRNAPMIRRVVACALANATKVIGDYLESAAKDSQVEAGGRGYAY